MFAATAISRGDKLGQIKSGAANRCDEVLLVRLHCPMGRRTEELSMNKLAIASAVAVALSSIAAAPVAAQDARVAISYGDLDLNTTTGAQALGERLEAGVRAVCDRPDIR